MHFRYGSNHNRPFRFVATLGSEPLLLAYVRWATLGSPGSQRGKFEQGGALAICNAWTADVSGLLFRRRRI